MSKVCLIQSASTQYRNTQYAKNLNTQTSQLFPTISSAGILGAAFHNFCNTLTTQTNFVTLFFQFLLLFWCVQMSSTPCLQGESTIVSIQTIIAPRPSLGFFHSKYLRVDIDSSYKHFTTVGHGWVSIIPWL